MITLVTKTSSKVLDQVAAFVVQNTSYLQQTFPHCSNKDEVAAELRKSSEPWYALITDRPAALFTLRLFDMKAILGTFCPTSPASIEGIISTLRNDLHKMKAVSLTLNAQEELSEPLARAGAKKERILIRLSGTVVETKLLPILPLNNPSKKDIPVLAKLMQESYSKSPDTEFQNPSSAERLLRDIMAGLCGAYLSDESFISGSPQNFVSACFVTLKSPQEANVTQLFTHPLYRARGLATIEIATSMNKLLKRGVRTLTVWVAQNNEVPRRLFAKLGFKEDQKLVEMTVQIP